MTILVSVVYAEVFVGIVLICAAVVPRLAERQTRPLDLFTRAFLAIRRTLFGWMER